MYQTIKEVDEETITKENMTFLTSYCTTSIPYDNVEGIGEITNSLILEAEVTNNIKIIGQFKDDSVYLLSDANIYFNTNCQKLLWVMKAQYM